MPLRIGPFAVLLLPLLALPQGGIADGYYGKYLGPLSQYHHGVSGDIYIVDARTIHIRDFTYDGEGPAAYFYVGNTKAPGPGGIRMRDETGSAGVLKKYNRKHITLTLPEGKTLNHIKWFSVWCDEFSVNFGDVRFPRGLEYPKPQKIGSLSGVHGVSSDNIVVVDAQTLLIPSFSYDGEAPDAKFWVGRGSKPTPQGIRVPDENGKQTPLRKYERKTIVLTLPGDLTVYDIDYFGIWCEAFTVDFGHIKVPKGLDVPPSLKMLGVSPQSKLNCEVLSDELAFEVRWAVAGDSIVIQLVAKLEDGEYMSFGLSGAKDRSIMVGGDVVVAWVDQASMNGYAVDYFLDAKSQCSGGRGSCPDTRIQSNTESVRLLNAALVNGYSIVTYQRPLGAHDVLDNEIWTNRSQAIIWAVGPLNDRVETSYHSITSKGDILLDFGRAPKWNCPIPDMDASVSATSEDSDRRKPSHHIAQTKVQKKEEVKAPPTPAPSSPLSDGAWYIPPIECNEPEDRVFFAQMGPTGGKRGYPAITGHVGWGISYYINGLLIPEINVVRGQTYTFVVEGGDDPNIPAKFHPLYITDDPVGGYHYKTPEERKKVRVFAGIKLNQKGEAVPTGTGRLCNWTPDPDGPDADYYDSFGAYQRTLTLVCGFGNPSFIEWTPDENTPDTVYYQCFFHRYMGWKINVLDRCDLPSTSASGPSGSDEEPFSRPSIKVSTRVKPDPQTLVAINHKSPYKGGFPYEIVKPMTTTENILEGNETSKVIPVNEDIDEGSTAAPRPTESYNVTLSSVEVGSPMPLVGNKVPLPGPVRLGYNNRVPPPGMRPNMVLMRPRPQPLKVPLMGGPPHRPLMGPVGPPRPMMVKKPPMRMPPQPRPGMLMHHHMPRPPMQGVIAQRLPAKPVYSQKPRKPELASEIKINKQPVQQLAAQGSEDIPLTATRMPIAVNTGFNPGSLVIEGGFKPIIPNHAQERIAYDDYEEDEDIGVIRMDKQNDPKSQNQMFEPMFIPSPLDSSLKQNKKPASSQKKFLRKPINRPISREEVPLDESIDERFYVPPNSQYSSAKYKPFKESRVPDIVVGVPQINMRSDETKLESEENIEEDLEGDDDFQVENDKEEENIKKRERRSAHHEPGHEGHDDHDHSMHDHDHSMHDHDHSMHDHDHSMHHHEHASQAVPRSLAFTTLLLSTALPFLLI